MVHVLPPDQRTVIAEHARRLGLKPKDLAEILLARVEDHMGMIVRLNRSPYYRNRLNAVVLAIQVRELLRNLAP